MNQKIVNQTGRIASPSFKPSIIRLGQIPSGLIVAAIVLLAAAAARAESSTNAPPLPPSRYQADWRWVKGAVFVPTKYVNQAQQWDEYDPVINDRELHYASVYGFNCVRVYLHYYIYLKKKDELLANIEDFLTRADKYGIKTEFVFFDDCWHQPDKKFWSRVTNIPRRFLACITAAGSCVPETRCGEIMRRTRSV